MAREDNDHPTTVYAKKVVNNSGGGSGAIYGLGIIGAWIYYFQHSTNFWDVVIGLIKGVFWPAVVLYKTLELLKL